LTVDAVTVLLILILVAAGAAIGYVNTLLILIGLVLVAGTVFLLLWKGKEILSVVVIILVILYIIDLCMECF